MNLPEQKSLAQDWFHTLRDQLCNIFEQIETELTGTHHELPSGTFTRKPWQREGGGGGEMSLMKGRVFEKVGVNISTVQGEFSETMRKEMPKGESYPFFWASGISVVAHLRSPLVPAVHLNTRMLVISEDREQTHYQSWFGGGADLTPVFPDEEDTQAFHTALKGACDAFSPDYYPKFKAWCDDYFHLKHRGEPRGIGGIFYDYINTGNFEQDFAFTRSVGEAFKAIYPTLVRRHFNKTWSEVQRQQQLVKRGRYVEFNLLYDRGTRFGLLTGGNTEAILMSLPPEVKW